MAEQKFDARLAEGVAYFEQMLEIMPEDRTTLEFLVVAYEQLNQHEKAQKSLVSLTRLLIKENDIAALSGLLPRLQESDYAPAKALALKVSTLTAPAPDLTPESPKELTEEEKTVLAVQAAIQSEKALGALLKDAELMDENELTQLCEQLDATPSDGRMFLISALQILEKENQPLCEKAMEFLADKFGTPPIPLAAFETIGPLVKSYPQDLVRQRGIVPFAKLGALTLVATLNPADERLRAAVEAIGPCRFFVTEPSAVETVIERTYGQGGA